MIKLPVMSNWAYGFNHRLGFYVVLIVTVVILLIIAILLFEIWMFVNTIQNHHISNDRRILWIAGMLILHPFIAIAYFLTDYKNN